MTHAPIALLRRLLSPEDLGHAITTEVRRLATSAINAVGMRSDLTWLYLAGPMTGIEDYNHPAFHAAEDLLRDHGYMVLNPARNGLPHDAPWEHHMRRDIGMLIACDGIALLPGWDASAGAKLEVQIANLLGLRVRTVDLWREKQTWEAA